MQALKRSHFDTAYLVVGKAEGWFFDLSKGAVYMDSIDFPNLEFLKASAISGTGTNLYGFEESAQY